MGGQGGDVGKDWSFENSIECPVGRDFAWQFWTDVSNWKLDSDVESVELNGPFAEGSEGVTVTRSSGRIGWRLTEVRPGELAVVEIPLPGGVGRFHWSFDDLGAHTRISQRVTLTTEQTSLIDAVAPALQEGIPGGMRRLAESMTKAAGSISI